MKALNFSASYYILKPIDEEELSLAINRADDVIRFDLSSFKEGLYIIRISSGGKFYTEKILKLR